VKVAFVTNLCTHYRRPLFEELDRRMEIDFFLTSRGNEWYTLKEYAGGVGTFAVRPAGRRRELVRGLLGGRYDVVVSNLAGRFAPLASYACARRLDARFVLWVGIWAHPAGLAHKLSRPLARRLYLAADSVVCYGPHVARFVRAESGRVEGVISTRQAVDNEHFRRPVGRGRIATLRAQLGVGTARLVTFVGRFEDDKGLDVLLEASSLAREPHCVVLTGKGSLEPALREQARALGIERAVRFPGYLPQAELPTLMQASDLVVLPSVPTARFLEPWGLILNEAMAAGTAVVATHAVGAAAGGLVLDGATGLVVPPRNAPALAGAVDRLLADEDYRAALARRAGEHVKAWSFEAAADVFEQAIVGDHARREAA
jgi:glycosyltransferase involved in cell wall biosynthesis